MMLYRYAAIAVDSALQEVPGTEQYAESVTQYKPGEIVWAGCNFIKVLYEI